MKKFLGIIVCILFMLPIFVKADMGSPTIQSYDAEVINPDGTQIYKYDYETSKYISTGRKLNYKSVISISEEGDPWGKSNYAYVENMEGYVNLKDIKALDDEYKKDVNEFSSQKDSVVLKKAEIRKGPAFGYQSTGVFINPGESIKIREIEINNPWYYVEYKGTKGFINSLNGTLTFGKRTTSIISKTDASITDINDGKEIGKIKANTIIKNNIYELDDWTKKYYIEYNGIKGFISVFDFGYYQGQTVKINKKVNVYKTASIGEVVTTLEKDTEFDTYYVYAEAQSIQVYYKNGDIQGWIICDDSKENSCDNFSFIKDLELKDDIVEDTIVKEDNKEVIAPNKPVNKTMIIIAIMGSIIAFLTVLVIVLLINKKKVSN